MREALEFIMESLEDCLEDADEESDESVPLVPLSEGVSQSFETASFQRLLRAIGFEDPGQEEMYWRIPGAMLKATMRKRRDLVSAALKGEFPEGMGGGGCKYRQ